MTTVHVLTSIPSNITHVKVIVDTYLRHVNCFTKKLSITLASCIIAPKI